MKKIYLLVLVTLAIAGCQKDSAISSDKLYLSVEGMRGGEKLAVEGAVSYWATGDRVRINDDVLEVTISEGAGTAVVTKSGAGFTSPYRGVYPSSIYSGNSSNTSYTLNLPANYTYATTTHYGRTLQNLQAPMVAYTDEGTNLKFKHVTGAVAVQVVNYYGFTIEVDNIVVTSTVSEGNAYNLCGMTDVTLSNGAPVVAASRDGVDSTKSVTMNFDGTDHLQIFAGDSAVVQIPVLPVGDGNKFKVQVTVHKVDQLAVNKTFENTQNTGGAMPRAKMGYARFTTGGLFTVNASGKKVIISQGNLQYQASTGTWQFAKEQYTTIGNALGNTATDTRSSQDKWIDLFGWGTSGWAGANNNPSLTHYHMPYDYLNSGSEDNGYAYGPNQNSGYHYNYTYSLTGDFANADWGVYNPISNGGLTKGRWRTLEGGSGSEVDVLLFTRDASTINNKANARYTKAKVNNIYGLIIFPDEYEHPEGVTLPKSAGINSTSSEGWYGGITYDLNAWLKMEAAGAVFLPVTGRRDGTSVSSETSIGYYWTSTYKDKGKAKVFYYGSSVCQFSDVKKYYGQAVRLVHDVN